LIKSKQAASKKNGEPEEFKEPDLKQICNKISDIMNVNFNGLLP
jgi:hypothetical protein